MLKDVRRVKHLTLRNATDNFLYLAAMRLKIDIIILVLQTLELVEKSSQGIFFLGGNFMQSTSIDVVCGFKIFFSRFKLLN